MAIAWAQRTPSAPADDLISHVQHNIYTKPRPIVTGEGSMADFSASFAAFVAMAIAWTQRTPSAIADA